MALFGNFTDIPILDLISLIGPNTGTLLIFSPCNNYSYLLAINHGTITKVLFNDQDVVNSEQALSFIAELVQANAGEFEFKRGEPMEGPHCFAINEVLLSSLAMIDEIQAFRPHFPEPETVFITNATSEVWIRSELSNGWHAAYYYFQRGVNALDIQQVLGLNLDQVLLNFYKLRVRGLIVPKRVFSQPIIPSQNEPEERYDSRRESSSTVDYASSFSNAGEDMVQLAELVDHLKPIWEEPAPERVQVQVPATSIPDPMETTHTGLQKVKVDRRNKGVVRSLMKSIWKMMSTQ